MTQSHTFQVHRTRNIDYQTAGDWRSRTDHPMLFSPERQLFLRCTEWGSGGWGRRGCPYGDFHRKWWRALRGLPTFLHCERALRWLLSVPRRAAAGATGAPQEPQDREDAEESGEHEDPGEPVGLRVLSLCPSRSVCHLNFFNVLNLTCVISSLPVLSSDLHPALWFRAIK